MQNKKVSTAAYLFLAPSFIGVSVFVLIPFGDAIRRSFYEAMSGKVVGIKNYITVFNNEAFKLAGSNTLRFAMVCIPLLVVISLLLALLLRSTKKHNEFLKTTFLLPMAIPIASIVLLWKIIFHKSGLLNTGLQMLGVASIDWLNTDKAFYVLVFSYLWKNMGYDMVLWLAGLSGISPSLYEAAQLDGAGAFARFRYITLPSLMPTLFVISVLSLLNSFKVFREAYLIFGERPQEKIYMLQHTFNNWFVSLDIQKLCAGAVIMASLIFAVILILQKFWGSEERE